MSFRLHKQSGFAGTKAVCEVRNFTDEFEACEELEACVER